MNPTGLKPKILRPMLTGLCALALTLFVWVLIVMLLDRRFRGYDNLLWAGSLWLSAVSCTMLVAYSRFAVRPGLGCTIAFAFFAIAFVACEGPIFGNVAQGGNPATTNVVVWNLVYLPLGVFLASEMGARLGALRRRNGKVTLLQKLTKT